MEDRVTTNAPLIAILMVVVILTRFVHNALEHYGISTSFFV